jgi:drug/metabolite transporter (DMT)-like permease
VAVIVGLSLFVLVGDPNQGVNQPSSAWEWVAAVVVVSALAGLAIYLGDRAKPTPKAALFGCACGLWSALSATFTKTTIEQLHHGLSEVLSHPEVYGLLGFGVLAFIVQQLALATGQLAPALATGSVANPLASVLLGVLLFQERLTRPSWHVIVAVVALLFALYGAVLITMGNRERVMPGGGDAVDHRRATSEFATT